MSYPLSTFGRRLRALRSARGLSQVELAQLVGRHQTTIGPYERDEYTPSRDIIERLAQVLDTSPEYLFFGRHPSRTTIPLLGRLAAAGSIEPINPIGATALLLRDERLAAFRLDDDAMVPAYRIGQIVLVEATATRDVASLLGRDVVAELRDGRALLRRLRPGRRSGLFDLAALAAPTLPGMVVDTARLVLGALDETALAPPGTAAPPTG